MRKCCGGRKLQRGPPQTNLAAFLRNVTFRSVIKIRLCFHSDAFFWFSSTASTFRRLTRLSHSTDSASLPLHEFACGHPFCGARPPPVFDPRGDQNTGEKLGRAGSRRGGRGYSLGNAVLIEERETLGELNGPRDLECGRPEAGRRFSTGTFFCRE